MKKTYIKPECGLHRFSDTVNTAIASQTGTPETQDTNLAEAKQWLDGKNIPNNLVIDLFK